MYTLHIRFKINVRYIYDKILIYEIHIETKFLNNDNIRYTKFLKL